MPLSSSHSPVPPAAPACQPLHCPCPGHPSSHSGPIMLKITDLFRHFSVMSFLLNINNVVLGIVHLLLLFQAYRKAQRSLWQIVMYPLPRVVNPICLRLLFLRKWNVKETYSLFSLPSSEITTMRTVVRLIIGKYVSERK